jgi:hypothetical protein
MQTPSIVILILVTVSTESAVKLLNKRIHYINLRRRQTWYWLVVLTHVLTNAALGRIPCSSVCILLYIFPILTYIW